MGFIAKDSCHTHSKVQSNTVSVRSVWCVIPDLLSENEPDADQVSFLLFVLRGSRCLSDLTKDLITSGKSSYSIVFGCARDTR